MKKLVIFCLVLFSLESYSQITLDFQLPVHILYNFKLNNSETKYFENDMGKIGATNQFSIYNPDGTLFKTIQLNSKPCPTATCISITNISESLFDNDPSSIEYLVDYVCDSAGSYATHITQVVRENGTVLLNEINATTRIFIFNSVINTENGPKLLLDYQYATSAYYQTKVFSLPGQIPMTLSEKINTSYDSPSIYPNPNNGLFFVKFRSNTNNGSIIDLYSSNGNLLNTYNSNNKLFQINNPSLSNGMYILNIRSEKMNSLSKIIINK